MQIMLGIVINEPKVRLINNVAVYYRRTINSAFIIKNDDFLEDKNRIFSYLLKIEPSQIGKFMILNRIFCLNIKNKLLSRVLNLNIYVFFIRVFFNFKKVFKLFRSTDINLTSHQAHFSNINKKATVFYKLYAFDIKNILTEIENKISYGKDNVH